MGPCPVRDAAQKMLTAYIRVLQVLRKLWTLRHPLYLTIHPHLEPLRLLRLRFWNLQPFLSNWVSHCRISDIQIHILSNTPPTLQNLGATTRMLECRLRLPGSSQVRFPHTLKICCRMTLVPSKLPCHHLKDHILVQKRHLTYLMALHSLEIVTQVWINCPADLGSCPVRGLKPPSWILIVLGRSLHLPAIKRSLQRVSQTFVDRSTDLSLQQPAT